MIEQAALLIEQAHTVRAIAARLRAESLELRQQLTLTRRPDAPADP